MHVPLMWDGEGAGPFRGVVALGYLRCCDWVSCSISSQIWSTWYFPRFLLRDGLFTQMNIISLVVLVMPCASLLVKQSTFTGCPGCLGCQSGVAPLVRDMSHLCGGLSIFGPQLAPSSHMWLLIAVCMQQQAHPRQQL